MLHLGITRDTLIDITIRDDIDLADAGWDCSPDPVRPQSARHGHSVEGADPPPTSPPVAGINDPASRARIGHFAACLHGLCRAPLGAVATRMSSSMIIRRQRRGDVMVPVVPAPKRARSAWPRTTCALTCWPQRLSWPLTSAPMSTWRGWSHP